MKEIHWNEEKNEWLKRERGIGFEDIVAALKTEKFLDAMDHPNQKKYPNQKIFVVEKIRQYAYLVPFVSDKEKIFLKTIFPNRKATKNYTIRKSKPL